MKDLRITVVDKIATYLRRDGEIVCGNSDYQIVFTFDSEWDAYTTKTARFIWNGKYFDQEFTGTTCAVPIISGATEVSVGVYAGDLSTTTPAVIPCKKSILCGAGIETAMPLTAAEELRDIRTGFDGTVYETAGEAVRAQGVKISVEPIGEEAQAVAVASEDTPAVASATNTADTVATFPATAGQLLDIRGIYNLENHGGVTHIDWGDGTSNDVAGTTDDEMKHTYATAGTYTVTLTGVEVINYGLRTKGFTSLVLGSTVKEIKAGSLDENAFTEVTIYAETPPTLASATIFDSTVTRIYVPNSDYLTATNWSNYASMMVVMESNGGGDDSGDNSGGNTDIVSGTGYKIIISSAKGTETLYIYQGQPGDKGKDGVSPTIAVEEIEGGYRLTITDKNGTQSVDLLSGEKDETADTKVTLTVTDGQLLDIRSIYRYNDTHSGVTRIDWGDGTYTDVVGKTDDEMKHAYTTGGTYTVVLTGLTHIPTSAFRTKGLIAAEIGSIVEFIGYMAFNENPNLTEVKIYAETPPEITFVTGTTTGAFDATVTKIIVPMQSMYAYTQAWGRYASVLAADEFISNVFADKVVTVGAGGDFATINEALNYLSMFYPVYKKGGVKCYIKILAGTVINEQIYVNQIDLQYITIIAEAGANNTESITIDGETHTFAVVDVNATGFGHTANAHDARGNYPFIAGENAAKLPTIGCVFRLLPATVESGKTVCGMLCNRGSAGVVLASSGFDGFYDGVIANNESSITIREGISRNMGRWGVHARHNGEVSARSCVCTNCGIGACADRVADLDVREAVLDGSTVAIECNNISRANANGCHANNCGAEGGYVVTVSGGGFANCGGLETTGIKGTLYNIEKNTLVAEGIIFA